MLKFAGASSTPITAVPTTASRRVADLAPEAAKAADRVAVRALAVDRAAAPASRRAPSPKLSRRRRNRRKARAQITCVLPSANNSAQLASRDTFRARQARTAARPPRKRRRRPDPAAIHVIAAARILMGLSVRALSVKIIPD